jgi:hypothetical protein
MGKVERMHAFGIGTLEIHNHCITFLETGGEIDRLYSLLDPDLVGLGFDGLAGWAGESHPRHPVENCQAGFSCNPAPV